MTRRLRALAATALLALSALPAALADDTLTASLDRDVIPLNETFTLHVSLLGAVDESPDFGVLEETFEVVHRARQTAVRVRDGAYVRETQWELTLRARREGEQVIPALTAGAHASEPLVVNVVERDDDAEAEDVFVEARVSNAAPYVQSEVIYTVRLFFAVGARGTRLSDPRDGAGTALVQRLGDDRQYQSERRGRSYLVWERRYSLVPQESGTLVIEPVTLEAQIGGSLRHSRTARFRSQPVVLEVQPIPPRPAHVPSGPWLPARAVSLEAELSGPADALVVGEPVTRTLKLTAEGQVASQLPELSMDVPDGIRVYPDRGATEDRAGDGGMVAVRRDPAALIASRAGEFQLPEVHVPWWNVVESRWEVASLPAQSVRATASSLAAAPPPALPQALEHATGAAGEAEATRRALESSVWQLVAVVTTLGWLVTLALWWRAGGRRGAAAAEAVDVPPAAPGASARAALRRVRQAAQAGDAPGARDALLRWAALHWREDPPRSPGAVALRLPSELARPVQALSAALYRDGATRWDGTALAEACPELLRLPAPRRFDSGNGDDALAPLWPR